MTSGGDAAVGDEVWRRVTEVARACAPGSAITPQMSLSDLGYDSVQLVGLILALEKSFRIVIDDADITAEHFGTVGAIIAFVQARSAAA